MERAVQSAARSLPLNLASLHTSHANIAKGRAVGPYLSSSLHAEQRTEKEKRRAKRAAAAAASTHSANPFLAGKLEFLSLSASVSRAQGLPLSFVLRMRNIKKWKLKKTFSIFLFFLFSCFFFHPKEFVSRFTSELRVAYG